MLEGEIGIREEDEIGIREEEIESKW